MYNIATQAALICEEPASGYYVTTACDSVSQQTVTAQCIEPAAGDYVTAACVVGDSSTTGTDTVTATCLIAGVNKGYTTSCVAGSSTGTGTAAVLLTYDCTDSNACVSHNIKH